MYGEKDRPPTGEGSHNPGKGGSVIRPPKKSEEPGDSPQGYSAKVPKHEGKAVTGGSDKSSKSPNTEKPSQTPDGMNSELEVPHTHLPALAAAKKGDAIKMVVYGTLHGHNGEVGKNASSTIKVNKAHLHEEADKATPQPSNAASMPLDHLKQAIKGSSPEFYSKD